MLKAVSAGLVAAGLLAAAPALAQNTQQMAQQTDGLRSGERAALTPDDRQVLADARIAALHTTLKLTHDQQKNWPAVESALRDLARQRADRASQRGSNREQRVERDAIERMRASADAMAARAAGLKQLADAAEPLYRSLDDGQKRRLRAMTRYAMGRHFVPNRH